MIYTHHNPNSRAAFSLIELLVSVFIISILVGLLLVGLNVGRGFAQNTAQRQTVVGIKMGVDRFKSDFGFLPPLVHDRDGRASDAFFTELDNTPTNGFKPYAFFGGDAPRQNELDYLRGYEPGGSTRLGADERYSVHSLAYYLVGALDSRFDGADGPGMTTVKQDGSFGFRGAARQAYFEPNGTTSRVEGDPSAQDEDVASQLRLVDANGVAIRYYRWRPDAEVTRPGHLNVPHILGTPDLDNLDDEDISPAGDNPALRDARYAIVAAGPNGAFGDLGDGQSVSGTEDASLVAQALDRAIGTPISTLEREGREDNIVEVGK